MQIELPDHFPLVEMSMRPLENPAVNTARSGDVTIYHEHPYWEVRLRFGAFRLSDYSNWQTYEQWIHSMSSGRNFCRIPLYYTHAKGEMRGRRPLNHSTFNNTKKLVFISSPGLTISAGTIIAQSVVGSNVYTLIRSATPSIALLYKNSAQLTTFSFGTHGGLVNWNGGLYLMNNSDSGFTMTRILIEEMGKLDTDTMMYFSGANTTVRQGYLVEDGKLYRAATNLVYEYALPGSSVSTSASAPRQTHTIAGVSSGVVVKALLRFNPYRAILQNQVYDYDPTTQTSKALAYVGNTPTVVRAGYMDQGYTYLMAPDIQRRFAAVAEGGVMQVIPSSSAVQVYRETATYSNNLAGSMVNIAGRIFMMQRPSTTGTNIQQFVVTPNPALIVQPEDQLDSGTHITCIAESPGNGTEFPLEPTQVGRLTINLREKIG